MKRTGTDENGQHSFGKPIAHIVGLVSEMAETIFQAVQEFFHMVRKLEGERLEAWYASVTERGSEDLQRFAYGPYQDKAAVPMGVAHSSNHAQAEGPVTRITLITSMMDGRAECPLVRQHVLHRFSDLARQNTLLSQYNATGCKRDAFWSYTTVIAEQTSRLLKMGVLPVFC